MNTAAATRKTLTATDVLDAVPGWLRPAVALVEDAWPDLDGKFLIVTGDGTVRLSYLIPDYWPTLVVDLDPFLEGLVP